MEANFFWAASRALSRWLPRAMATVTCRFGNAGKRVSGSADSDGLFIRRGRFAMHAEADAEGDAHAEKEKVQGGGKEEQGTAGVGRVC